MCKGQASKNVVWAEKKLYFERVKCKEVMKKSQKGDRSDLKWSVLPHVDFILQEEELSTEERETTHAHCDSQG